MVHESLANYYDFLGLKGYSKCHEYHFFEESYMYRKMYRYYMSRFNKLLPETGLNNPNIIPTSWYQYKQENVDNNTKRNAVKTGLEKWLQWEQQTLQVYQDMYRQVLDMNEFDTCAFIKELVCNVSQELKKVKKYYLNKKAIDYNLIEIIEEQQKETKGYKEKVKKIWER